MRLRPMIAAALTVAALGALVAQPASAAPATTDYTAQAQTADIHLAGFKHFKHRGFRRGHRFGRVGKFGRFKHRQIHRGHGKVLKHDHGKAIKHGHDKVLTDRYGRPVIHGHHGKPVVHGHHKKHHPSVADKVFLKVKKGLFLN